jgi:6-phosphogluconate dehydrogenase (decarboxylating)
MQLGMIGLGRIGSNMGRGLIKGATNASSTTCRQRLSKKLLHQGAVGASSLEGLGAPRYERFSSRGDADFANKVRSAMRHGFGGHVEKMADKQ